MKKFILILIIVAIGALVLFLINDKTQTTDVLDDSVTFDPRNASFKIENAPVDLKDGFYEVELASIPGAKITTRYFGNELKIDLDGDGRLDSVFVVTQESGGSGMFYYVVSVLDTERGFAGSDGYFLGDRIAPQTIEVSKNPRHKNVVVVNFADRAPGEPMTTQPSIGKSVYLKLETASMQWGIVEPDFEGESASGVR